MKENLVFALRLAIDMKKEVQIELSTGNVNSMCVYFIPDAFELFEDELIIWRGDDMYTVDLKEIVYNEITNEYACGNSDNALYISF